MPGAGRNRAHDQDELAVAIGERIRRARNDQRVTLRDLAADLGVSPSTMSAVENGHTTVSAVRLTEIASVLDVPVEVLLVDGHLGESELRSAGGGRARKRGDWRVFEPAPFDAPLQAALEAFMDIGYHGATMRDIARRADLSVPGVYHHYASKQDMLVTILNGSLDDLIWRYEAAVAEADDTYGRFTQAVECLVLFHTRRRDWAFLGRSEQRSLEGDAAVLTREKRVLAERSLIAIIEEGRNAGIFATKSSRVSGRAVIMMCVGTVYWFREDGPDTPETIARQYVDLALRMVEYVGTAPTASTP
ncbi:TetR family transcriptional regulator [Amycolatopsis pithecellobii]|uniref:TetR family transcriptional regulator n=1 Tax=Amycolatopsis pithecellobii TaxID=664692 RepID=A0A6N7Z0E6_9PSEU|nr:TetR family transcriptional regulator [Amycolatopsis pithecellobii]MTD52904.1 TetR family transcriptional regulator [Amycolatopsis pithecellobii]